MVQVAHNCTARAAPGCTAAPVQRPLTSLAAPRVPGISLTAGRRCRVVRAAGSTMSEEEAVADLWQHPDRKQWYEAKFCADDQPDWNEARFVSSRDLTPALREVTVEAEVSRELVPLRNAYKHPGQRAAVRVNGGAEAHVSPSVPPFPLAVNEQPLYVVRGDIFAGDVKTEVDPLSVTAELKLVISKEEAPDLWEANDASAIEVGPFEGTGLALRGPIQGFFKYPTIILFVSGTGIATARALVLATDDVTGLSLGQRADVRVYYRAPNQDALAYADEFEEWEAKHPNLKVATTTGTFLDAFDEDDTLIYDPDNSAAIVLVGGDEEEEEIALEATKEADIQLVVKDSDAADPTKYLDSFTMPKLVIE